MMIEYASCREIHIPSSLLQPVVFENNCVSYFWMIAVQDATETDFEGGIVAILIVPTFEMTVVAIVIHEVQVAVDHDDHDNYFVDYSLRVTLTYHTSGTSFSHYDCSKSY
jgi:hypothetical protein